MKFKPETFNWVLSNYNIEWNKDNKENPIKLTITSKYKDSMDYTIDLSINTNPTGFKKMIEDFNSFLDTYEV